MDSLVVVVVVVVVVVADAALPAPPYARPAATSASTSASSRPRRPRDVPHLGEAEPSSVSRRILASTTACRSDLADIAALALGPGFPAGPGRDLRGTRLRRLPRTDPRGGPTRSTVFTYVNPAVAVAAGALFLGEPLTATVLVVFALILAGSFLATAPAGPRSDPRPVTWLTRQTSRADGRVESP
jgi:hypothetical protein